MAVQEWTEDVAKALAAPFPPEELSERVLSWTQDRRRGLVVHYIDSRAVMDRLDAVVGPANWSDAYTVLPDGGVECRLTVLGVTKTDVGYKNREDDPEPLKAAYADSFKRASVKHGPGRPLYSLPLEWVDLDGEGRIARKGPCAVCMAGHALGAPPVVKPPPPAVVKVPTPMPVAQPPVSEPTGRKATDKQVGFIYSYGTGAEDGPHLTRVQIGELCMLEYGEEPAGLTIRQASEFIKGLQDPAWVASRVLPPPPEERPATGPDPKRGCLTEPSTITNKAQFLNACYKDFKLQPAAAIKRAGAAFSQAMSEKAWNDLYRQLANTIYDEAHRGG